MKKCPNCGFLYGQMDKFSYEKFAIFWRAYPRKVGKGAAERVWVKLKATDELFQKILEAVEAQKKGESWQKEGGIYIPHPSTWLNQRRWEDEVVKSSFVAKNYDSDKFEQKKKELDDLREKTYLKQQETKQVKTVNSSQNDPNGPQIES